VRLLKAIGSVVTYLCHASRGNLLCTWHRGHHLHLEQHRGGRNCSIMQRSLISLYVCKNLSFVVRVLSVTSLLQKLQRQSLLPGPGTPTVSTYGNGLPKCSTVPSQTLKQIPHLGGRKEHLDSQEAFI